MNKTRILFVMLQLDAGGSERVVFDLARSLDPEKFEVFVAAFKGGVLAPLLKNICNEVFIIDKKQGLDVEAMLKLVNIIKKYRIDVVNAHHYMSCFYSFLGTKIFNGKKLIYTEHSVTEVESKPNCIHSKLLNLMLYRINAVIGVSSAITEKFRILYPCHANKFNEILNGVDIEKFRSGKKRDEVRTRWGLTEDHFVVGTVANFRKVKNHACLVRAAGRLKEAHLHLRLIFVGTGFIGDAENSEAEVRSLIRDCGLQDMVILAGYQEDIAAMLSAFDIFCLPSFSEGLPVSLLEAMASGVPAIGSNVAGITEVITQGETGILFPSDDDEQLAAQLMVLSENTSYAKFLASNGAKYIENNHSNKSWTSKYETLFTE